MFPIVITPAKKMQGSQERMYRKSGDVYLNTGRVSGNRSPATRSTAAESADPPASRRRRLANLLKDSVVNQQLGG